MPTRWLSAAAVATTVTMTAGLVAAPAAQAVEITTAYALVETPLGTSALTTFSTTQPGTLSTQMPVVGLQFGEDVLAIDVRPATGVIYGVTSDNRLVTLTPQNGVTTATAVGTLSTPVAGTNGVGFDFNPVVDRLRIVTPTQNLRVNPVTVAVTVDTPTAAAGTSSAQVTASAYTNSKAGVTSTELFGIDSGRDVLVRQDANAGTLTSIGSGLGQDVTGVNGFDIAPADNTAFAALQIGASSQLFMVNLSSGTLTPRGSFPTGTTVRGLALASPGILGFAPPTANGSNYTVAETGNSLTITVRRTGDSEGFVSVRYAATDGTATKGEDYTPVSGTLTFAAGEDEKVFTLPVLDDSDVEGPETVVLTLSDATGGAALLPASGGPDTQPKTPASTQEVRITDSETGTLYGVTDDNELVTFTINSPGTATTRPIGGLNSGERATGIDLRPANGRLYITTNQSRLLTVDTAMATTSSTAATTAVGTISPPVNGNVFGVDFNPVADRLRVVSDNDQNLRVNPDTPASSVVDGTIDYATGNPNISAVAYTNNVRGATGSTRIYGVDDILDVLVTSDQPNSGDYQTVGATGVNVTGVNGFDISGKGGLALGAFIPSGSTTSSLYRVDLATGRLASIGAIATSGLGAESLVLTGLTFGEVGTASANPPKPDPKGDSAVGRVTLDIGARGNTITAGNRPLLSGVVSDTAAQPRGIAGKDVQILQKVYNTNSFVLLETVRTNANGRYELRVNPDRQRAYVARVVGPNGTKQSDQDGQRQDVIFVNNRVNVAAPVGGARIGRSTTVRGDLDPDFASIRVGVATLRNGRFTYVTQGVTDSRGAYTINVRNLPVGDYALVVYTSARQGTLAGAASRAVSVR